VHTAVSRAVARTCLELGIASRELAPDYFSEE
jgi:hypothetical protein